jgi:hypothetical protein
MFLNENGMFKFQINLDRHGPRPIMKICYIPDPPSVLIVYYCTFEKESFLANVIARLPPLPPTSIHLLRAAILG